MRTVRLLACIVLCAAFVPTAGAHGPPAPNDPESRLLVDHNDDCGENNDPTKCRGTHDLIAVYVREAVDAQHGDVVILRFIANAGDLSSGLKDVFTFKAGGSGKTLEMTTSNNRAFTTGGNVPVARVGAGVSLNDPGAPGRYSVEMTLKRSDLGDVGTALSAFKVQAFKGSTKGDYMPGGYVGPLDQDVPNPDQGSNPTNAAVSEYKLKGPSYYVTVTAPGAQQVAQGDEAVVQVNVANPFRSTAQSFTFSLSGADGLRARFHDANAPNGEGYSDTLRVDLPKSGSTSVHVALAGERAGASGTLTLTVTTDQGGRSETPIPYTVLEGEPTLTTPPGGDGDGGSGDKGAPGVAPIAALAAIALAALLRRRA